MSRSINEARERYELQGKILDSAGMENITDSGLDRVTELIEALINEAVTKYQTEYEQRHLVSAVKTARIDELKQIEPPEQYEYYARLMGSEFCKICGFNAVEFRKYVVDRLAQLKGDKE